MAVRRRDWRPRDPNRGCLWIVAFFALGFIGAAAADVFNTIF